MFKLLLNEQIYHEFILRKVLYAQRYLWIVTADIKDMHVESDTGYIPFLQVLAERVEKGVAVRLIHAKEPGPRFREDFDNYPTLFNNELFERILCPRVHTKAIIIDGLLAFTGSPNLTGAGMGGKNPHRRNFEAGFVFDDKQSIMELQNWVDNLYLGNHCIDCQRRAYCPDPIIDNNP